MNENLFFLFALVFLGIIIIFVLIGIPTLIQLMMNKKKKQEDEE